MRADKWLWHARFFKTRGLAAELVSGGHLRVNGNKVSKPAYSLAPGDILTFPQGRQVRVVRVLALSQRRGPAREAQGLFEDLSPPATAPHAPSGFDPGSRPSGKDRRMRQKFERSPLD